MMTKLPLEHHAASLQRTLSCLVVDVSRGEVFIVTPVIHNHIFSCFPGSAPVFYLGKTIEDTSLKLEDIYKKKRKVKYVSRAELRGKEKAEKQTKNISKGLIVMACG